MSLFRLRYRAITFGLLVGVAVLGAVFLASGGGAAVSEASLGIPSISGMSEIISGSPDLCAGLKGTSLPSYCSWPATTGTLEQGWVQTAAIDTYGPLNGGLILPVPLNFAEAHPGPAEVFVEIDSFATESEATQLLNDPDYTGSWNSKHIPLPNDAVNGGLAFQIDSGANDGLTEFRFVWVGGTSVVDVNVLGANMSVGEAQEIAQLANPG